MNENRRLYTLADVAMMSMLTDRTIRTHIKDRRLCGTKIGGKWYFSAEDLERFFKNPYILQGIEIKNKSIVADYVSTLKKPQPSVCAIYDCPVEDKARAEDICEAVLKGMKTRRERIEKMTYFYDHKNRIVRIILSGDPESVSDLIRSLHSPL
jgi:hypothetical protein